MKVTQNQQGDGLYYLAVEPEGYDPESAYPIVVLMHGYGANMRDLADLSPAIHAEGYVYIFPNAPIPFQIGPDVYGYAWTSPGEERKAEEAEQADDMMAGVLREVGEKYGADHGQMVLGGFSQGGMMTYRGGLTATIPFAGLVALSARVSEPEILRTRLNSHRELPIFVSHGTQDTMIPVQAGRESVQFLQELGYDPEYHEYPIGHGINEDVVEDLRKWLTRILPPGPRPRVAPGNK